MKPKRPRPLPRRQTIREEFTNLPNLITMARIAAIPFVLYFLDKNDPRNCVYATIIFVAAALSDIADGVIARRRGMQSVVGKFLDPLADKLLIMATLVYLVGVSWVPEWLAALLIGREIAITSLRAIAGSEGLVISASSFGKTKTVFQVIGISMLVLHFPFTLPFTSVRVDIALFGTIVIYISLALSLFSAAQYIMMFFEAAEASALARRSSTDITEAAEAAPNDSANEPAAPGDPVDPGDDSTNTR